MNDDTITISCPKCRYEFDIDAEEVTLSVKYANQMADKAMLEIPEKFRGFYKPVFQSSPRHNKQFTCIACRVCDATIIVALYRNDVFEKFMIRWHYDNCAVDMLESGKYEQRNEQ